MTKKLSIAVLSAALLMSGAWVGVSFAGGGGITEPEVIELSFQVCGGEVPCRFYDIRTEEGQRGLFMTSRHPLFDLDGSRIGTLRTSCVDDWVCTYVHTLREGPYTERGTVVATGVFTFDDVMRFAVTGGTGPYMNVRGQTTIDLSGPGDDTLTLSLIP